jgi:hypothetical protein
MKINALLSKYLASSWKKMFQTTVLEKIKMHILCSITLSHENRAIYENVEENGRAREATCNFLIGVTTVMWCLKSALCTVCLERDFMTWSSVMWFWPFYHHVTDSRHDSPTIESLADNGTFCCLTMFWGYSISCREWGRQVNWWVIQYKVGQWYVISSENNSWECNKCETSPVLILIQL